MVESFFTGFVSKVDKSPVSVKMYGQMIGSLLYLALRTRPNILASVLVLILARIQNAPTAYCHRACKRILRYLRGTDFVSSYFTGNTNAQSFVDSDYAADTEDCKSMTGYIVNLAGASVIWGSRKQTVVTISTCEAEYYALTHACKEVIWLGRVLKEAGLGRMTHLEVCPSVIG